MEFHIVKLHPEQWRAYKKLRLRALKEEPAAFSTRYDAQAIVADGEWKARLERYYEGNGNWMLFARIKRQLVGMMGAFQTAEDARTKTAHIMAVFVLKSYRGKGISKLLLTRLLDELKKKNVHVVELGVNPRQKVALALYTRFGFAIFSKKRIVLGDGKRHTEYLMKLRLSRLK